MELGILHYIYLSMILVIILSMSFKMDTVLPCIIGLFLMGLASSGSLIAAVQVIFNAMIAAGKEFLGIIVIISLVVAMSKALGDIGADELMLRPIKKVIKNKDMAFWTLGIVMMVVSFIVWPSPAVALVGAIMLPAARNAGLPAIWAASAMNIFGHGVALSGDFFIQGAPEITAKATGLANAGPIISATIPLWLTMSTVTIATSFFMMKKDLKSSYYDGGDIPDYDSYNASVVAKAVPCAKFIAIITPLLFIMDAYVMYKYKLRGGDATALVGGTAVIVMSLVAMIGYKPVKSCEKVTEYIKDGFIFGIKIFAPVIVIGAFFFLGSEGTAKEILGPNATGLLTDIGLYLADKVPLSKGPVVIIQAIIGGITGLDGSGFSGLPLVGSLAQTFSSAINISKEGLAALGQITAIWVGGGTIIPWGVISVAAICGVDPRDLAAKNIIPVSAGFIATIIMAMILF